MTTSRLLLAIALPAALAACEIGGGTKTSPAAANCSPAGNACAAHADCCSYGCELGVCARNPVAGGVCKTSDDCDWTMTCVNGACAPGAVCRYDADVCTYDNACCSGNCVTPSGTCAPNHPPTIDLGGNRTVPYYRSMTLAATVADPDGDTLLYGWTLVSGPPGNGLGAWTSNAASPTVFLDVPGAYLFRLAVTDGPQTQRNRLTSQADVTLTAVNEPPVVSAGADVPSQLRNVAVTLTGSVSDPNGAASVVSCAWYQTPPGGAETAVATFAVCPASPSYAFTPPLAGPEGDWTFRLLASDGALAASASRVVHVVNGAPTAAAGPDRVGNLGAPGQTAPAVPLVGSGTDPNQDSLSYAWAVSAVSAPGSAWTVGAPVGSTASTTFVPDKVGTYTLRLRVDDGWGGTADDFVTVTAEPYLRPLLPADGSGLPRGEIAAAAYAKAGERIVMVGTDRSGASPAYRLWILDPTSQSAPVAVALGAEPSCLALSPDQSEALVGELGARWQRVTGLGATPSASAVFTLPFEANDLVHAGTRAYAVGTSGSVYELLLSTGAYAPAQCQNCGSITWPDALTGNRGIGALQQQPVSTGAVWLLDTSADTLSRYDVKANGNLDRTAFATGLALADRLWLSADGLDLVLGNGKIHVAATLAAETPQFLITLLHFDSSVVSTALQGITFGSPGSSLTLFSTGYTAAGGLAIPQVGVAGTGFPPSARFAFVRGDGQGHSAVVKATVSGADRYYLASY